MPPRDVPKLDVLLIGPYPPPLGGVSAHVKRLAAVLQARGLRIGVINHFRQRGENPLVVGELHRNPLLYRLAVSSWPAHIVHYHHSRLSTLVAVSLATQYRSDRAYLITIHSHNLQRNLESRFGAVAWLTRWSLRRFDEVVAVSPEIARTLEAHLDDRPIMTVPAYLPPDEDDDRSRLPEDVSHFLRAPGRTMVTSAYRITRSAARHDDYGLDTSVATFCRLAPRHPDLRLLIFLAQPPRGRRAKRYLDALMNQLAREKLSDRAAICVGLNLTPAFASDVVYLRPSRVDGDAVSIREALDAGLQVVASDVVVRPRGVTVAPPTDVAAWCAAVERALARPRSEAPFASHATPGRGDQTAHAYAEELLQLYARHLPAETRDRLQRSRREPVVAPAGHVEAQGTGRSHSGPVAETSEARDQ
jgi:glycosyltransferase involved in cell wall biosynthesis